MPNQSSHVRCVLKKRKSDIVTSLQRGIRQRPAITTFPISNRPHRGRMSWETRRSLAPARKARPRRSCARHGRRAYALLRCTEPLQALACGTQAGADLKRLAKICDRARLVAKAHPGLTTIIPGV